MTDLDLPLAEDLRRFLDGGDDPVEGALIVAGIVDDTADANWARDEIGHLANAIESLGEVTPRRVVEQFAGQGFRGADDNYYDVDNSVLDHVLRTRRGIPISLGVVLIGIARRLGLDALGVNFPRHFLVTVGDLLVDPYAASPTSVENCRRWLKENNVDEAGAFNIADAGDIAMRMLNNVRMLVPTPRRLFAGPRDIGLPVAHRAGLLRPVRGTGGRMARPARPRDGRPRAGAGGSSRTRRGHGGATAGTHRAGTATTVGRELI